MVAVSPCVILSPDSHGDFFIIYKDADVGTKKYALPFRYRRQELLIPVSENKKQVDG